MVHIARFKVMFKISTMEKKSNIYNVHDTGMQRVWNSQQHILKSHQCS